MIPRPDSDEARDLMRQYLLNTMPPEEQAELACLMQESSEWRTLMDRERRNLALLDVLPQAEPRTDITAAVMAQIRVEEAQSAAKQVPLRSWRIFYEYAAAAVLIIVAASILLPALGRARESARRSSCANNLKQFGLVCRMYANADPNHQFPPLTRYDGLLMVDLETVYPEYVSDLSIFMCPDYGQSDNLQQLLSDEPKNWRAITHELAKDYVYLDRVTHHGEDLRQILAQQMKSPAQNAGYGLHLLQEGAERFYITDANNPAAVAKAQAAIPVMFDNLASKAHVPEGANILYMDGHVEFERLGNKFPATKEVSDLLNLTSIQ